ncbi:MAG: helix-turn-helix domain-containing protein, partial [Pseudonocardia sp.]
MARLNAEDATARADRDLPPGVGPGDFSEALARGLRVLQAFDGTHRRMTIADIARAVGLPRATVRRSVTTLVHLGYLSQDGRMHELTPRVLRLATTYLTANTGSAVLQPACERLCAAVGESTSVAVLDGEDAVMIARSIPNQL